MGKRCPAAARVDGFPVDLHELALGRSPTDDAKWQVLQLQAQPMAPVETNRGFQTAVAVFRLPNCALLQAACLESLRLTATQEHVVNSQWEDVGTKSHRYFERTYDLSATLATTLSAPREALQCVDTTESKDKVYDPVGPDMASLVGTVKRCLAEPLARALECFAEVEKELVAEGLGGVFVFENVARLVSVQVHWGNQTPQVRMNFHTDSHMCHALVLQVTLQGERQLYAQQPGGQRGKRNFCTCLTVVLLHLVPNNFMIFFVGLVQRLTFGSVSIQCMVEVEHSVSVDARQFDERTIALLCRLGMTSKQFFAVQSKEALMNEAMRKLAVVLTTPHIWQSPKSLGMEEMNLAAPLDSSPTDIFMHVIRNKRVMFLENNEKKSKI